VSALKSYCQSETADAGAKLSHEARFDPAPMQKTSVAASQTGP